MLPMFRLLTVTAVSCLMSIGAAKAGPLGYSLTGMTHYTAGCGAGTATIGQCGAPATGWLSITNSGPTVFVGSAQLFGVSPSQTIDLSLTGALNPGESWVFNAGPNSASQGGFNNPVPGSPGAADLGLQFTMNGVIDGDALMASIYDSEIRSGVLQVNPFGLSVDSFVMQGGDPFGRYTGNDFAEAQVAGRFVWSSRGDNTVPEPASLALVLGALSAAAAARRRHQA